MSRKNTPTWLEEVRRIMRLKNDSLHTERTYSDWIKQFVRFHRLAEKDELFVESEAKVESFLSGLAVERNVAVAAQNQAMKVWKRR